ncbi:3-keto-disaccharide hydrolase [Fimbriiglobus ruber]|uniref:Putative multi-domain protein n=1 Tax=Fimbriiglobus ruber TaxID=1908690 RepID=A0A225DRG4_9BACT|nr:DUF1080 domain-containing protein [Fimbriiglobus ruber]OWK43891.1 putative multi-domain protein [Fimbriiglobus ruber]
MRHLPAALMGLVLAACPASPVVAAEPDGWTDLLKSGKDSPWKSVDKNWIFTDSVSLAPAKPDAPAKTPRTKLLAAAPVEGGGVWVNGGGRVPDLITKQSFGDCEVHVEFLIAEKSNSGIKFHAVYEIQILDSYGKKTELSGDDCGGIYPRAELKPNYHHIDKGTPPKVNAAKPAGEWQTLDVVWQSPRFDDKGEKTANAKVVKAILNGQVIHEDQELKTPTGNNYTKKETPTGPFMLQADHGPVAFRNVKIKVK